jgi:hypothetical protein
MSRASFIVLLFETYRIIRAVCGKFDRLAVPYTFAIVTCVHWAKSLTIRPQGHEGSTNHSFKVQGLPRRRESKVELTTKIAFLGAIRREDVRSTSLHCCRSHTRCTSISKCR